MPKTLLIALVTVVLHDAEGRRFEIPPGEEIPDGALSQHDIDELKKSKSIQDPADVAAVERDVRREEADGNRAFEDARQRVQAAGASIEAPASAPASAPAAANKPAAKTPAKR